MTISVTSVDTVVRSTINGLVNFDLKNLREDTALKDIGLASLDYVTIRVAIRKKLGKQIDLEKLKTSSVSTYGDFINYIVVE